MIGMDRLRGLEVLSATVREFSSSDQTRHTIALLEETRHHYLEQLVAAEGDRVIKLQAYIAQLDALRSVLAGGVGTPKI